MQNSMFSRLHTIQTTAVFARNCKLKYKLINVKFKLGSCCLETPVKYMKYFSALATVVFTSVCKPRSLLIHF